MIYIYICGREGSGHAGCVHQGTRVRLRAHVRTCAHLCTYVCTCARTFCARARMRARVCVRARLRTLERSGVHAHARVPVFMRV